MPDVRDATRVTTTAEEKERRAQDAQDAMRQYEEQKLVVLANTERLRALRLEKEAADAKRNAAVKDAAAKNAAAAPAKKVKKRA